MEGFIGSGDGKVVIYSLVEELYFKNGMLLGYVMPPVHFDGNFEPLRHSWSQSVRGYGNLDSKTWPLMLNFGNFLMAVFASLKSTYEWPRYYTISTTSTVATIYTMMLQTLSSSDQSQRNLHAFSYLKHYDLYHLYSGNHLYDDVANLVLFGSEPEKSPCILIALRSLPPLQWQPFIR